MPNTPGLELESLFLRIYMQGQDVFARATNEVRQGASRIEKAFAAIEARAGATSAALGTITGAVEALGAGLRSMAQVLTGTAVGNLTATLGALSNNTLTLNLSKLAKGMTELAAVDVSKTAQNLGLLAEGLKDSKLGNKSVRTTASNLNELALSLGRFREKFGTNSLQGVLADVGSVLSEFGTKVKESKLGYESVAKIGPNLLALEPGLMRLAAITGLDNITKNIGPAFRAIGDAITTAQGVFLNTKGITAKTTKVFEVITSLGTAMDTIKVTPGRITGLEAITTWLGSLEQFIQSKTLNVTAAKPIIDVIGELGKAIRTVGMGRAGNAAANVVQLTQALNTLSGLNTGALGTALGVLRTELPGLGKSIRDSGLGGTKSIANIAANLTGFTQALGTLATMQPAQLQASAMAMGNWIKTLTANVNPAQLAVLTAMGRALTAINKAGQAGGILPTVNMTLNATANKAAQTATSVGKLSSGFNHLGRSAIGARTSLTLTQLTLAGFAGFGLIQFARFDEALARTEARMGGLSGAARDRLRGGVLGLSQTRATGADQLASASGVLHSTGMNQAMTQQALPVIEDFAQVAGIDAARAARALTSTLGALGMASMNAGRDLRSLRDIADAFVHTSQVADTTVEELTEAFSGRFVAALRQVGWGMRQGLTLITAYAQANVRGADAGNRASIVLQSLEHALVGHMHAWEALGLTVEQFGGLMRQGPAAVFSELEKRLQGLTPIQQRARLELMGFESRVTQALYPILGLADSMRLVSDNMRDLTGVSERSANIIRQSFGAQIKIVWNNVKALAIDVGDALAPAIGWLSRQLKTLTDWFRMLSPAMQRILVLGALIGPLTTVAGILLGMLGSVSSVVLGLLSFKAIVVAVLLALNGVQLSISGIFAYSLGTAVGWRNIWNSITGAWRSARGFAASLLDIAEATAGFFINWEENLKTLTGWFDYQGKTSYRDFGEILATIVRDLVRNFEQYFNWFSRNWRNMLVDATCVIETVFGGIGHAFVTLVDTFRMVWNSFWESEAGRSVERSLTKIGENATRWLAQTLTAEGRDARRYADETRRQLILIRPEEEMGLPTTMGALGRRDLDGLNRRQLEDLQRQLRSPLNRHSGLRRAAIIDLWEELESEIRIRRTREQVESLPERMRRPSGGGGVFRTEPLPPLIPIDMGTIGQGRMRQLLTATAIMGGMSPFGAAATNLLPMSAFPSTPTFNFGGTRRAADPMSFLLAAHAGLAGSGAIGSGLAQAMAGVFDFLPNRRFPPFPQRSEGEELFSGIGAGTRSPGHEFKSLSLSRFILGGAATARIEQQVRDTALDKRVQNANDILGQQLDIMRREEALRDRPPLRRNDESQVPQGMAP